MTIAPSRRAVGVVRVSRTGEREAERLASPPEQKERIATACERDGLELVDTIEELDVSGGTPLAKRHGLRRALEMVEAGEAEAVVVADLDRLVRSLTVQPRRRDDGTDTGGPLEPDPVTAPVVAEAFRLRAEGATIMEVREHLRGHGIERSFHGVTSLLASRIYLGELRFGDVANPDSHPSLVDADTFRRVQRLRLPPDAGRCRRGCSPASATFAANLRRPHGDRHDAPGREGPLVLSLPAERRLSAPRHDRGRSR